MLGHFAVDLSGPVLGRRQRRFRLGDGLLEEVDLLQRFEDLVFQNALGHFVGGDLFQQGLILAVVGGGVQLALQVLDLSSPDFS